MKTMILTLYLFITGCASVPATQQGADQIKIYDGGSAGKGCTFISKQHIDQDGFGRNNLAVIEGADSRVRNRVQELGGSIAIITHENQEKTSNWPFKDSISAIHRDFNIYRCP